MMLSFGIFSLVVSFLAHIVWWRVRLPEHHVKTLALIFVIVPVPMVTLVAWTCPQWLPASPWQWLQWLLFYLPCSLVYIGCYTLLELRSPTLSIMQYVAAAGTSGRTEEDIRRHLRIENMLAIRVAQTEASRLIERKNDGYRLTGRGMIIARLLELSTKLLGVRPGG